MAVAGVTPATRPGSGPWNIEPAGPVCGLRCPPRSPSRSSSRAPRPPAISGWSMARRPLRRRRRRAITLRQECACPRPLRSRISSRRYGRTSPAHHLARWLTRTQADAEDALQEAVLRAFRSFDRLRPASPRSWLLRIVRNCCYDLRKQHEREGEATLDEEALPPDTASPVLGTPAENPETRLLRMADAQALEDALRDLVPEYREVFLLREIEGLAYKEIAEVAGIPVGTVMSRLSRARAQLRALIVAGEKETA